MGTPARHLAHQASYRRAFRGEIKIVNRRFDDRLNSRVQNFGADDPPPGLWHEPGHAPIFAVATKQAVTVGTTDAQLPRRRLDQRLVDLVRGGESRNDPYALLADRPDVSVIVMQVNQTGQSTTPSWRFESTVYGNCLLFKENSAPKKASKVRRSGWSESTLQRNLTPAARACCTGSARTSVRCWTWCRPF